VGFQNSATGLDLGFYAARSYSASAAGRLGGLLFAMGRSPVSRSCRRSCWSEL